MGDKKDKKDKNVAADSGGWWLERLRVARPVMLGLVSDMKGWKCARQDTKKSKALIEVREGVRPEGNYKMWRCTVDLGAAIETVEHMIAETDQVKKWNPLLHSAGRLTKLDKNTEVLFYAFQPFAAGLISSREFVTLCGRETLSAGTRLLLAVGCDHPNAPLTKDRVRGWTGPSGFVLTPNKTHCRLTWIINADSRLPPSLPSKIVDRAFVKLLVQMMRTLAHTFQKK